LSPEERAEKLAAYLAWWLCVGIRDIETGEIAAAIREAENEVLEKAAALLERNADPANIVGYMQIEDAKVVRSLAQPSPRVSEGGESRR
jgi:hypothetical protein